MSCFSAIVVAVVFLAPPLSLAVRFPDLSSSGWKLLGVVTLSWLALWGLLSLVAWAVRDTSLNRWLDDLVWVSQPGWAIRLVLLVSVLVLLLAVGGMAVINAVLNTVFVVPRDTVVLAVFALIAEIGRVFEGAARDERAWQEHRATQ